MKRPGLLARLLDKLQWRPLQVYLKHYRSAELDLSAIAVAYYMILTAFPLVVIAANIFPYLSIDTGDMLAFLKDHIPEQFYSSVAGIVRDIFSKPSGRILGVATVTAFWTLTKSLSSLQKAVNKAYGASEHRDVFISHIVGIFLGLIILFLLTFSLLVSTFSQAALKIISHHYDISKTLSSFILNIGQPATFVIIFLALALLYFVLPNVKITKFRYVMPGTVFTTLVITFLSSLFGNYVVERVTNMVDIKLFGSIIIFVFMLWFIFLAHILILGAIFNATFQELRTGELQSRRGDVLTIIQRFSNEDTKQNSQKTNTDEEA
ncbi:YihY/virulence factor BrkB family protein [Streptococcus dentiloxodontae]